jgi:tetratricopeptide (TPR) repeat protein
VKENTLERAQTLHAEGRLAAAESAYRESLANQPNAVDALEGLGVLLFQMGRMDDAAALFARGVALQPEAPRLHAKLGAAYRNLRRFDEAEAHLQKALELDPALPEAWNSLGRLAHDQARYADAEAAYHKAIELRADFAVAYNNLANTLLARRRWALAAEALQGALRIEPNDAAALSNLAQALGEQGNPDLLDEAEAVCRNALALAPGFAQALDNLGNVLRVRGRLSEAVACYEEALRGDPSRASSHRLMGHVYQYCDRFQEAGRCYEAARSLQPNDPKVYADLGSLAAVRDKYDESARHYQRAVALDPSFAEAHQGLGQTLLKQGHHTRAEASLREALRLDPELAASWDALARLQAECGDLELSCQSARTALALQPTLVEAYWRLAIALKGRLPDVEFQAMERLLGRPALPQRDRALLHFGLGTVCDARGAYEQAAAHLEAGNALQDALKTAWGVRRDPDEHTRFIDRMIAEFTPEFIARTRGWGDPDPRPVFVVGLPRTGTTLVEQVLASHPDVHGAGELREVLRAFETLPAVVDQPRADAFDALRLLTPTLTKAAARPYLERMDATAPSAALRVVDKMPDNVQFLGMIALLWAGARVIVCNRDLRDVAASCWLVGFEAHPWTNNWELMAQWFANHQRIMEHWRATRPVDLLEVDYEDMVRDLEGHARRMVNFLNLEWHPACLDFHKTRRMVRTASFVQVREPVYSRSIGRWKRYETSLQPLKRAFLKYGVTWERDG